MLFLHNVVRFFYVLVVALATTCAMQAMNGSASTNGTAAASSSLSASSLQSAAAPVTMTVVVEETKKESKASVADLATLRSCDIDRLGCEAQRGDAGALRKLNHYGYLYSKMPGQSNKKMAFRCFDAAASSLDPKAVKNLGCCYFSHLGVGRDIARAKKLFTWAMNKGNADAIFMLARCYKDVEDEKTALVYYKKAADEKVPGALTFLGLCYEEGSFGVEKDEKMAAAYLKAAAQAKDYLGMTYYARCLITGIGGTGTNAEEAIALLKEAAQDGCVEAVVYLAYCYANGIGIESKTDEQVKAAQKQARTLYAQAEKASSNHFVCKIQRYLDKIHFGRALQDCSICMVDFNEDRGVMTPCGHRFHSDCIGQWFSDHTHCPVCRRGGLTMDDLRDC